MPRKKAHTDQQLVRESIGRIWDMMPGIGGKPPPPGILEDFTLTNEMQPERDEIVQSVGVIFNRAFTINQFRRLGPTQFHFDTGAVSILDTLREWEGLPNDSRPANPLRLLLQAYAGRVSRGSYRPMRRGILPEQSAKRKGWNLTRGFDTIPDYHAQHSMEHQSCLPEILAPNAPVRPALIAVMDKLALVHYERTGTPNDRMETLPFRIFVELMLALEPHERDGRPHAKSIQVKTIVEGWLGYGRGLYKPGKKAQKLFTAIQACQMLYLPELGRGFYFPVMVERFTGMGLNGWFHFLLSLPAGKNTRAVGPSIDLKIMRLLGAEAYGSYRAYLGMVYDWDHSAASRRSRLQEPTREKMLRNSAGQLLEKDGEPVFEDWKPVMTQHHPKAVPDGNDEREPNPLRERYTQYGEDGIRTLALPDYMAQNSRRRSEYTKDATKSIERVAERKGCVIEALGHAGGFPWRIMPPDGFNEIPFADGESEEHYHPHLL